MKTFFQSFTNFFHSRVTDDRGMRKLCQGVTLVETLMVFVVLAAVLGGIYKVAINVSHQETEMGREGEFVQLQARMCIMLRADLRAARSVQQIDEYSWQIEQMKDPEIGSGGMILWRVAPSERLVTREGEATTRYDYNDLLPAGEKLKFQIQTTSDVALQQLTPAPQRNRR